MQSLCASIPAETRPQMVPSPSNSPLSLEPWGATDIEKFLSDNSTPTRNTYNSSESNRNGITINRASNSINYYAPWILEKLAACSSLTLTHMNIPSPPSVGPLAAESPTLYESAKGASESNRQGLPANKTFNGNPPWPDTRPLEKFDACKNLLHVSIPSPSSSVGHLEAESPTLYESANGFGGSHIRVKRERVDEYPCHQIRPTVTNIKREEDQGSPRVAEEDFDTKFEVVRSLAMQQATTDIYTACGVLGISSDPDEWSVDDVNSWLGWNISQYGINLDCMPKFHIDGVTLGSLSEEYFRQHIPRGGDIYAQLDIWKAAAHLQKGASSTPESFRPEDSMLDMSAIILSQLSASSASATPAFHRMSPPAGSGGTPVIDLAPGSSPTSTNDFSSEGIQSDDEGSEESFDTEGRCTGGSRPGSHAHIHLWQFLKELLTQPHRYGSCIRWLDRPKGIFKIEDSVHVARLWGKRKNRPAMNYDKLSRSIRQYYKKGIMKKTERSQRLVYQFCHPYGL